MAEGCTAREDTEGGRDRGGPWALPGPLPSHLWGEAAHLTAPTEPPLEVGTPHWSSYPLTLGVKRGECHGGRWVGAGLGGLLSPRAGGLGLQDGG